MGDYYGHGGNRSTGGAGDGGGGGSSSNNNNKPPDNNNKPSSGPGSSLHHSDHAKIFVGGLSWQTTEESLRWHFEQYGQVISVEVMRDRITGDPRGFAFVVFSDSSTVDLVMKDKDKHEINHKFVDVKRAQARGVAPPSIHEKVGGAGSGTGGDASTGGLRPNNGSGVGGNNAETAGAAAASSSMEHQQQAPQHPAQPSPEQMHCKVFVGGIPPQVDRDDIKNVFERFGAVSDAIVMMDQATQRSRGFGFVTFQLDQPNGGGSAAAQRSIQAQPVVIQGRNVEVKLATPREGQPGTSSSHKRGGPQAPKYMGLRAGQASSVSTGEFAGLAVAFGRSGWKAGYGTKAFGKAGWNVWEDTGGPVPEKAGFSFDMLKKDYEPAAVEGERPAKRAKT